MADYNNSCEVDVQQQQEVDYVPSCGGRREALLYCRQMSGSSVISELTAPTVCESYGSSIASSAPRSVTLQYYDDNDFYEEEKDAVFFDSGAVVIKRGGSGSHRKAQQQHHHHHHSNGKRRQHHHHADHHHNHHHHPQALGFDEAFQEDDFAPSRGSFVEHDQQPQQGDHGFAADFDGAFSGRQQQEQVRHDETYGLGNMTISNDKKSLKKLQIRAAAEQLKRQHDGSCSTSRNSDEIDNDAWQRRRSENQLKILEDTRGGAFSATTECDFNNSTTQSQHFNTEPQWDNTDAIESRPGEGPLAKKLTSKAIRSVGNIIKVGGGALLHVASKKPSNYDGLEDDDGDVKKGFSFGGLVGGVTRRASGHHHSQELEGRSSNGGNRPRQASGHHVSDSLNFADSDRRRSGALLDRINESNTAGDEYCYSDRIVGSSNPRRR